ncbi:hypothetical protein, partial [Staphylococcus aureus]|uniref:hypothetical protein n=1 Tax=Staphylococcus aureus TaxID=1280 RepID=UPI0039BDF973
DETILTERLQETQGGPEEALQSPVEVLTHPTPEMPVEEPIEAAECTGGMFRPEDGAVFYATPTNFRTEMLRD